MVGQIVTSAEDLIAPLKHMIIEHRVPVDFVLEGEAKLESRSRAFSFARVDERAWGRGPSAIAGEPVLGNSFLAVLDKE